MFTDTRLPALFTGTCDRNQLVVALRLSICILTGSNILCIHDNISIPVGSRVCVKESHSMHQLVQDDSFLLTAISYRHNLAFWVTCSTDTGVATSTENKIMGQCKREGTSRSVNFNVQLNHVMKVILFVNLNEVLHILKDFCPLM